MTRGDSTSGLPSGGLPSGGLHAALHAARAEAAKSTETFRLGAAVLSGRSVVSRGRNRNSNACGLPSIHAEMDAMWRCRGRQHRHIHHKLHLVVVRVLRDNETTACSKPCAACTRALARLGVARVTYTTGDPQHPVHTDYLSKIPGVEV